MPSCLDNQVSIALMRDLKRKVHVDRFMSSRSIRNLAARFNVSDVTMMKSIRDQKAGKLSPIELTEATRLHNERVKHRQEYKDRWTVEALSELYGVHVMTVRRYYAKIKSRHLSERMARAASAYGATPAPCDLDGTETKS